MSHVTNVLTFNGEKFVPLPFVIKPAAPFGFPFKEQQMVIAQREFPVEPGQEIVCSERGGVLIFQMREIKDGYAYYTPLKQVIVGPTPRLW